MLEAQYPIGAPYISFTDSRNPSEILGFGTWEALAAGCALIAQGSATAEDGSALTFTAGSTYGEFKHQLTVAELPSHSHNSKWGVGYPNGTEVLKVNDGGGDKLLVSDNWRSDIGSITPSDQRLTTYTGGSGYHSLMQKSEAVYIWKRIS